MKRRTTKRLARVIPFRVRPTEPTISDAVRPIKRALSLVHACERKGASHPIARRRVDEALDLVAGITRRWLVAASRPSEFANTDHNVMRALYSCFKQIEFVMSADARLRRLEPPASPPPPVFAEVIVLADVRRAKQERRRGPLTTEQMTTMTTDKEGA